VTATQRALVLGMILLAPDLEAALIGIGVFISMEVQQWGVWR